MQPGSLTSRKDDTLPRRFFEEPIEEGRVLRRDDFDRLLKEYYELRGWDEMGVPLEYKKAMWGEP